jgi:GTP diphosphokinase / guanosine-3',5'-bis(diphosphate) 3'-diphosphatase
VTKLERALRLAVQAHAGQTDKAGAPYILHPLRVMLKLTSETEMITGVLHDVLEDSLWTEADLRREGFSEEILAALECLTRQTGETYDDFILRAAGNPLARKVKLADLEDNLNLGRLETITEPDRARLNRYEQAWKILAGEGERERK